MKNNTGTVRMTAMMTASRTVRIRMSSLLWYLWRRSDCTLSKMRHNGKIVVPSYLCEPVPVDKDNYKEVIIGGGYYTEEQLAE